MSQEPDLIQELGSSMVGLITQLVAQLVPPVPTLRNRLEPEECSSECCSNCKQTMLATEVCFYHEHNPYNK